MSLARRKPLRLSVETLESRQLLSQGGGRVLPFRATSAQPLHAQAVTPRPDLAAFAWQLAHHPRRAARMGLSGLSQEMGRHAGFAARHGWGACLAMELRTHPAYAAAHHLTVLVSPRGVTTPVTPTAVTPAATTPTRPAAPSVQPTGAGGQGSTPQAFASTVKVGGTLDVTVPNGGLSGSNLTYTITPQPLPANMTFNRGTGEFIFVPAPDQVGTYNFTVTVSDGTRSVSEKVPVAVTNPAVPSTQVSGQVVDESGRPLGGIEVMLGDRMTTTDKSGVFTLTGVPASPGPLTVDGLHAVGADRMMVMAPTDQLLGHQVYANADNVIAKPITLPRIDVAHSVDLSKFDHGKPIEVTNPALPGVRLTLPPNSAKGALGLPFAGKLTLTRIPADAIRALLPPGVIADLIEVDGLGLKIDQPVQVTVPNTAGYKPGTVLNLWTMNWHTGAHDLSGHMVVGKDGASMTSIGGVLLASGSMSMGASRGGIHALSGPVADSDTSDCIIITPSPSGQASPVEPCLGCQTTGNDVGDFNPPNDGAFARQAPLFASDAGMVTGEFFQDHATVSYQSQGQSRDLVFEYSSLQADPRPVVEFDPSTQVASASNKIFTITAQVTLGGVVQVNAVTYTPNNLQDGTKFRVPLQVDATQLATGAYPYTMAVTVNYIWSFAKSA